MNELTKIGMKHGTDKAGPQHNYTEVAYWQILSPMKNENIKLLELGVGDTGASIKMWREFMPNAKIGLFDPFFIVHPSVTVSKVELEELGVSVIVGNQLDRNDLSKVSSEFGDDIDVIIDDASHVSDGMQKSLAMLFPLVKSGGYYIVEDLFSARDRDARLNDVNAWLNSSNVDHGNKEVIYHTREIHLADVIDYFERTNKWLSLNLTESEKTYLEEHIDSCQIYRDYNNQDNLVVIKKK